MKAKILPLEGKYYGSRVEIFDEEGRSTGEAVVWLSPPSMADYRPSEREYKQWADFHELTLEEAMRDYEICNNHYETTLAYEVCLLLERAINEASN